MLKGLRTCIFSLVHKEKKSQDMLCWFRNAETAKSRGSIFGVLNKIAEEKKKEKEEEKSRKKKRAEPARQLKQTAKKKYIYIYIHIYIFMKRNAS